jgi:hypothetical protein
MDKLSYARESTTILQRTSTAADIRVVIESISLPPNCSRSSIDLLLLRKGGQTVYFGDIGEGSSTLLEYFERNGGPHCDPDANP